MVLQPVESIFHPVRVADNLVQVSSEKRLYLKAVRDGILLRVECEISPVKPLFEPLYVHSTIIAAGPKIRQITFDATDVIRHRWSKAYA